MKIEKTTDYEKFDFFVENRKPDHVEKIRESIKRRDLTKYIPILATLDEGKMKIIDGQNRFLACKALGKPIYYILAKGLGHGDMIVVNNNQKNWSYNDYLRYWCSQRVHDYLRIRETIGEIKIPISTVIMCVEGKDIRSVRSEKFKTGQFRFTPNDKERILEIGKVHKLLQDRTPSYLDWKSTVPAIQKMLSCGGFVMDKLHAKLDKFGFLVSKRADWTDYLCMLEEIYNHHNKDKVYFTR